jgi:hypothetical protein
MARVIPSNRKKPSLVLKSSAISARDSMDTVLQNMGIKTQEDIYSINETEMHKLVKMFFPAKKLYSLARAMSILFPEFEWHEWRFQRCNRGFWDNQKNHRMYFDWVADELCIEKQNDWYNFTINGVKALSSSSILSLKFKNSLFRALYKVYPEFQWLHWKFTIAPDRFWDLQTNRTQFLQWIEEELNIRSEKDWYKVKVADIVNRGGSGLLARFNFSLFQMLKEFRPEHEWRIWLFGNVPPSHWSDIQNQRKFLEWIADELGMEKQEDWYNVSSTMVMRKHGAGFFMNYYGKCLYKALRTTFPECTWHPWLFDRVPDGYWKQTDHLETYMEWLSEKLHITTLSDWNDVSNEQLNKYGASSLSREGFHTYLEKCFPHFEWQSKVFGDNKQKTQQSLHRILQSMFLSSNSTCLDDVQSPLLATDSQNFSSV